MESGYQGRDLRAAYGIGYGSPLQFPYQQLSDATAASGGGGGGASLLKRSLTELERQQQIQHAIFMRSVKQRTHLANISAEFLPISSPASSSTTTSFSSGFGYPHSDPDTDRKFTMQNRLQELERQLLDDDDEDDPCASDSAVTAAELGETMQHLISPPQPPQAAAAAAALSPTTSTSSTTSSTASCSPASATPSRQLLLDTAAAVADGAMDTAAASLAVLNRAADRRGDPEQRLTSIMVAALLSRINPRSSPSHPITDPGTADTQSATQLLFDLCPCFKLGLLAANLTILDATRDSPKIHILDFDVGQGGQHAALITALADRHRRAGTRPPAVKITAITESNSNLSIVGDRIASLAERMGVALRFNILKCRINDLDTGAIGSEPGEALAVNLAFYLSRVADESVSPANPRDTLLRHMRMLAPRVVVLVEQNLNANTAPFLARFSENCGHYGALLESLDATAARESADRLRVEAGIGLKAVNSVAREGAERVERCEVFGKWRARMGMAGLRPVELGPAVCEPVRARLGSLRGNPGFSVKEEGGGLCFGWMGRVLTVASAWQ